MTADLIAAFRAVVGADAADVALSRPRVWDGGVEGPVPDEFVSADEAAYRQARYDDWLTRDAS